MRTFRPNTAVAGTQSRHLTTAIILSLFILSEITISLADPRQRTSGPRISVRDEVFDFGLLPPEALATHTFWLKNTGTARAEISRLATNCGCTQAPLTDSLVPVGDSVPVQIMFGSRTNYGQVEKFTRIFSNAVGRVPALSITAKVLPDSVPPGLLVVTPKIPTLELSPEERSEAGWEVRVTIKNTTGVVINLKPIDVPEPFVTLAEDDLAIGPKETRHIAFRLRPDPGKAMNRSVTFELSDAAKTHLTIPFAVAVK